MEGKIQIILTGGTIDGCALRKSPKKSTVKSYLEKMKLNSKISFSTPFLKDSRKLGTKELETIASIASKSACRKILITHGTFTMAKTAVYLKKKLKGNKKTVILTGAFTPIASPNSDAPFNLGFALCAVRKLPAGVYICMNGTVFNAGNAKKNIGKNRFERKK